MASHRSSRFAKSSGRVARSVLTTTQPGPTTRGLRIISELGEDVTPLSLQDQDSGPKLTHSVLFGFGEGSEDGASEWSPMNSTYTRTITDKRGGTLGTSLKRSTMLSGFSQTYIIEEKESELVSGLAPTHSAYHSVFNNLDDEIGYDLEKPVICHCTETETINLFELPSTCVPEDDQHVPEIETKNAAYEKLCKSRAGNSRYTERAMQTINEPLKIKGTQASQAIKAEESDFAQVWDMFDEYKKLEPKEEDEEEDDPLGEDVGGALMRPGGGDSPRQAKQPPKQGETTGDEEEDSVQQVPLETLPDIQEKTFVMEKALCMNTYQQRLAQFRRMLPGRSEPDEPSAEHSQSVVMVAPHMLHLWNYRCPEASGQRVTCVRWNPANPDLLAVTYGTLEFGLHPGLVCCWSPKNPDHPALIYHTPSGAICCDFATQNAAMLAVGCYDGSLALYSTSQKSDRPVTDCFRSIDKPMGVIWDVQFVLKDQGVGEAKREVLMSISEDGRVLQWNTRQGLQTVPVMSMRRDPSFSTKKENRSRKSEAFISRSAVGLHFSFRPGNTAQYLVATEAGTAHLCSTSHSDQYLFTYSGHLASVYRAHWSPFSADVLITCSADWSFRVWHAEQKVAVIVVQSASRSAINDIQWSPLNATQLALCTDHEVEVWDLAVSTLDPLIVHPNVTRGATNTTLTFGPDGESLMIGDTAGSVAVYQLENLPAPEPDHVEKLQEVVQTQLFRVLSTLREEQEEETDAIAE